MTSPVSTRPPPPPPPETSPRFAQISTPAPQRVSTPAQPASPAAAATAADTFVKPAQQPPPSSPPEASDGTQGTRRDTFNVHDFEKQFGGGNARGATSKAKEALKTTVQVGVLATAAALLAPLTFGLSLLALAFAPAIVVRNHNAANKESLNMNWQKYDQGALNSKVQQAKGMIVNNNPDLTQAEREMLNAMPTRFSGASVSKQMEMLKVLQKHLDKFQPPTTINLDECLPGSGQRPEGGAAGPAAGHPGNPRDLLGPRFPKGQALRQTNLDGLEAELAKNSRAALEEQTPSNDDDLMARFRNLAGREPNLQHVPEESLVNERIEPVLSRGTTPLASSRPTPPAPPESHKSRNTGNELDALFGSRLGPGSS